MQSNYNNFSSLEQAARGALIQAEQLMRSGRMIPLPSQQKNTQIFRVTPNNAAPAAGRGSRQSGAGVTQDKAGLQPDSEVYRETPADQFKGQGAGDAATGSTPGSSQTAGAGSGSGVNSSTNNAANAGASEAANAPVRSKAPDSYEKQLKLNFNEDNLLSGIIMAEVLGRPKCLRRGRW